MKVLLWLWCRLAATAPFLPLALETPYATDIALKRKKKKIELPYDAAIPFLGIYLDKTAIQKDTCIPVFIAALLTTAKI